MITAPHGSPPTRVTTRTVRCPRHLDLTAGAPLVTGVLASTGLGTSPVGAYRARATKKRGDLST
jgi:hypothetical protein